MIFPHCYNLRGRLHLPHRVGLWSNDGSKDRTLQILIDQFRLYRSNRMASGSLPTAEIRSVYRLLGSDRLLE